MEQVHVVQIVVAGFLLDDHGFDAVPLHLVEAFDEMLTRCFELKRGKRG
jgi:hypothetical protein